MIPSPSEPVSRIQRVARRLSRSGSRSRDSIDVRVIRGPRDGMTLLATRDSVILTLEVPKSAQEPLGSGSNGPILPARPTQTLSLPVKFLTALHECGRSTTSDPARFALHRIQVRGAAGEVIGSDGHQALIWSGFEFPFEEDLLVPALPLFGSPEWTSHPAVSVGRTELHLVVSAGPWTVWLPIDATGRYPDV